jgi:hypothetical protein
VASIPPTITEVKPQKMPERPNSTENYLAKSGNLARKNAGRKKSMAI